MYSSCCCCCGKYWQEIRFIQMDRAEIFTQHYWELMAVENSQQVLVVVNYVKMFQWNLLKWGKTTYLKILRIDLEGNFFTRENHFTSGNRDWFRECNIPSEARDVIFPKPVEGLFHNIKFHERLPRSFKAFLLFYNIMTTI